MNNHRLLEEKHPIIISHRQDLDGVFFAVVMSIYEKIVNDMKPTVYFSSNKDVNDIINREVRSVNLKTVRLIIGDLNPKLELLRDFSFNGLDITFIDHHSGEFALHDILKKSRICTHINYDMCATRIAYLHFMSGVALNLEKDPHLVKVQEALDLLSNYVNDRDLFLEKYENSIDLQLLYNVYGPEALYELFYDHIMHFPEEPIPVNLLPMIDALKIQRKNYIKAKLSGRIVYDKFANTQFASTRDLAIKLTINLDSRFAVLFAEHYESDIARFLLDKEIPEFAPSVVFVFNELRGILRIVTKNDLPIASKIAKQLGGNGHALAAGVSIKTEEIHRAVEDLSELYREHFYTMRIPMDMIEGEVK